jgi:lipoprotein-anchoring transpeptidase ErfK/SrfK
VTAPRRWTGAFALLLASGCGRSHGAANAEGDAALDRAATAALPPDPARPSDPRGPKLAVIDMQVNVHARPDPTSPRFGYLRLGTVVDRDAQPAGNDRCPGGWYRILPRGYVCSNQEVTFDMNHPLVRAASVRPDTTKPLPYKYAFLSGAAPLYLRIPNSEEQKKAEYHLTYHEGWWGRHHNEVTRVTPGANDVAIDETGVPVALTGGEASPDAGSTAVGSRRSTDLSLGELLGGRSDADPIPFWLEDGRTIANVADYKPGPRAYFAKKAWRHTGLALVGTFPTGPDSRNRRFAVTVDLRLVPVDRLKPDTASAFHGAALSDDFTLPLAIVRSECDPKEGKPCAHAYKLTGDESHQLERTHPYRSFVRLSGKKVDVDGVRFYETKEDDWVRARDVGAAFVPDNWPLTARNGQKWIEVSIRQQSLVLWEGQKPVYMTLVSTGQDGMKDPKTTKSTPMGFFRIQSKHLTATMDANEQSNQGKAPEASDKDVGEAKIAISNDREPPRKTDAPRPESRAEPRAESGESKDPDDKQWGRPEGSFELRDVPYVEYFSSGYALHAAYWHDVFGTARSHGCINLSPIDAHRLFLWTDPQVPDNWHGVFATKDTARGTLVMVHE